MQRRIVLTLIALAMALPTSNVMAEAPSNAELHQMILQLRNDLAETKAENKALKQLIAPSKTTDALSETTTNQPKVADGAAPQVVKDQPIPLHPKIEKSYLTLESADGNIKYWVDGRVFLDSGFVDTEKNSFNANTEFRRLRLAIKTKLYKDWFGEFDTDFAPVLGPHKHKTTTKVVTDVSATDTNKNGTVDAKEVKGTTATVNTDTEDASSGIEIKDLWIAYGGFPNTTIKVGNHKPPFSMAELTTSRWETFMETPMVTGTFAPGRRIGLSASNWGNRYSVGTGIFGDELHLNPTDNGRAERMGWAARGVYRPIVEDNANKIVHLGLNYLLHKPQSDAWDKENQRVEFKYNVRPEAHFVDYKLLDTGNMRAVDEIPTWGLELAGKRDRFYAQSEYLQSNVKRDNDQDPDFSGWYAMAAFFLTNDSRSYSLEDGEFGPVMPNGPLGAFELAIRYSTLDLNDNDAAATRPIIGGKAKNTTIGINWYANNNLILRANYIHANLDENANGNGDYVGNDDLNIYGMRIEYLF
ncbi:MAG: hypothetical protein HW380_3756 [Magnetococcales bacterium]|nr:hypothetical protein [Magnetococcales bacterium]HIJ83199.1 hypothetical protein [Magnetococcales bacterium]